MPKPPAGPRLVRRTAWASALAVAAGLGGLAVHVRTLHGFLPDDTFISLRYAQRLLEGHGLTWTEGVPVEGYTNLALVLAAAAFGALGMDLVHAVRLLCALGGLAMVLAVWAAGRDRPWAALSGVAVLAASGSVAGWIAGGLETVPLAGVLCWAVLGCWRGLERGRILWWPPALLGLAVLLRGDAPVLVAGLTVGVLAAVGPRRGWRPAVATAAAPASVFALHTLFRLHTYGDWVPNTARVKVALSWVPMGQGIAYVGHGLLWLAPALLLAGGAAWSTRADAGRRHLAVVCGVTAAVWLGWVVFIGGDIFPARRHLTPVVGLAAVVIAGTLRVTTWRGWLGSLVLVAGFAVLQAGDRENFLAQRHGWGWEGRAVGRILHAAFDPATPLVAVDAAGAVPYHLGWPAVDMLGLNDRAIALAQRFQDAPAGSLAHSLGDGAVVLARKPDAFLFAYPTGAEAPRFRSGKEAVADPTFHDDYQLVRLHWRGAPLGGSDWPRLIEVPDTVVLWVRRDGLLGSQPTDDTLIVPAWLLSAEVQVDDDGPCAALAGADVGFRGLRLPDGAWRVDAGVGEVTVVQDGAVLARGPSPLAVALAGAPVDLAVTGASGCVQEVVVSREP